MKVSVSAGMYTPKGFGRVCRAIFFLSTILSATHAAAAGPGDKDDQPYYDFGLSADQPPCEAWVTPEAKLTDSNLRPRFLVSAADRAKHARDYALAATHLEELLTLTPEDPRAHSQLANAYQKLGKLAPALVHATRTFELEGPTARNLMTMIQLTRWLGQTPKANELLDRAILLYPRDTIFLGLKTQDLLLAKKYAEALKVADHNLQLAPDDEYALGFKAEALMSLGRNDEAALMLITKLKLHPQSESVLAQLAHVYINLARPREALQLTALIKNESVSNEISSAVYQHLGDFEMAERLLRKVRVTDEVLWKRTSLNFTLQRFSQARNLLAQIAPLPTLEKNPWVIVAMLQIEKTGKLGEGITTQLVRKAEPTKIKQAEQMAAQLTWEFVAAQALAEVAAMRSEAAPNSAP